MAETPLPKLLVSREEAHQKIQKQIEKGQQFHKREIGSARILEEARAEGIQWSNYNKILLLRLFDSTSIPEYTGFDDSLPPWSDSDLTWLHNRSNLYRDAMVHSIKSLEGIQELLELSAEPSDVQDASANKEPSDSSARTSGDKVFIVHGHDNGTKETVARFIEHLGIQPIILHEQPSRGETIIEKIERCSDDVVFAIVLITPDDVGGLEGEADDERNPRPRQNVVFELGYFMGKLGRERVCPLFKGEVENPSDIDGIVYIDMDAPGAWRKTLRREISAAIEAVPSE